MYLDQHCLMDGADFFVFNSVLNNVLVAIAVKTRYNYGETSMKSGQCKVSSKSAQSQHKVSIYG